MSHTISAQWFLDGILIGQQQSLDAAVVPPGSHTLELIASDPTPKVRKDVLNRLTQRIVWSVRTGIIAEFANPKLTIPAVHLPTGVSYSANLTFDSTSGTFQLMSLNSISGRLSQEDAMYNNGVVELPRVKVGERYYRATLQLISTIGSMRFKLVSATEL